MWNSSFHGIHLWRHIVCRAVHLVIKINQRVWQYLDRKSRRKWWWEMWKVCISEIWCRGYVYSVVDNLIIAQNYSHTFFHFKNGCHMLMEFAKMWGTIITILLYWSVPYSFTHNNKLFQNAIPTHTPYLLKQYNILMISSFWKLQHS